MESPSNCRVEKILIGWSHPGFLIDNYPEAVSSQEHRRCLLAIDEAARNTINLEAAMASVAIGCDRPSVELSGTEVLHGWSRIWTTGEFSDGIYPEVFKAIGGSALTPEMLDAARHRSSHASESFRSIVRTAAHLGFQDPAGVVSLGPAFSFARAGTGLCDRWNNHPPFRLRPVEEEAVRYLRFLPDYAPRGTSLPGAGQSSVTALNEQTWQYGPATDNGHGSSSE